MNVEKAEIFETRDVRMDAKRQEIEKRHVCDVREWGGGGMGCF